VKWLLLLPLRLLGQICVIALLIGGPSMWVIPNLAARHHVDMSLLVLRVLDAEGPARPLRRLGGEAAIQAHLLDLRPEAADGKSSASSANKLKDKVVSVSTTRTKDGDAYTIRYSNGKTETLIATTPHTTVPAKELTAARNAVSQLYSPRKDKEWSGALAWGESLFVSSWVNKYDPGKAPRERFPGPAGGTEDEQIWCVWQALRSGAPEQDLAHLPELFSKTFPDKKDQELALGWASTLYQRMSRAFSDRKPYYEISKGGAQTGTEGTYTAYSTFQTVLPPETHWTHLWLLQQFVGLSPAAQEAARLRWLQCFPASREQQVLQLGARLVEERRSNGEALPPVPEVLPALCVVERLTGIDAHGQACQEAVTSLPNLKLLVTALQFAYPNDDLFYVLASGNRLEFYPSIRQDPESPAAYYLAVLLFVLVITSLAWLGVQSFVGWIGNRVTNWTGTRHLWDKNQKSRGKGCWWLTLLSILLFSCIGYLLAPSRLPQTVLVQVGSQAELFYGSLMATAVGGFLITACRRVLALFLTACGVDVTKTWIDEALGIVFGGLILYHFGNDLAAITLFALVALTPGVVQVRLQRLWQRPSAAASTTAPQAGRPVQQGRSAFLPTARG
jgi:hypothetical protein